MSTAPAVEEMFKEIERIRTAPPTIEELKLSKGAFSLSLAGLFESSEQTANTVGDLFTYDLPLDYYEQLPAKIDAVTAQDVQRMANTYLHPETSVVIGAGDRSKIEDSLKKLAIGPVELRDADGNPVKAAAAAGQAHESSPPPQVLSHQRAESGGGEIGKRPVGLRGNTGSLDYVRLGPHGARRDSLEYVIGSLRAKLLKVRSARPETGNSRGNLSWNAL